ncbi:GGDEF domain-containing protein [Aestuariirhabdus sp. LZHN29]|uniref:GGDEF domain-containing protein n=1 Tax=Aestuariirhabdus sp. LZHN29 TaxID=3417462 RepID=UPI003CF78DB4
MSVYDINTKKSILNSLKQKRWRYAFLGVVLSFIGPLGEWLFVKLLSRSINDSFYLTLIYTEIFSLILFSVFGYILGKHTEKIEQLAFHDNLTGLYNRHYLFEKLNELMALHKRYQEKLSLVMIDLDHFKKVNDSYGHAVGDKTLKAAAKCIMQEIRDTDLGSRYGGEEFVIICPHTAVSDCHEVAERIRTSINSLQSDALGFPGPQTISAGVYELSSDQDMSLTQILNNIDVALYHAKKTGRNKVVIYSPDVFEKRDSNTL